MVRSIITDIHIDDSEKPQQGKVGMDPEICIYHTAII